MKHITAITGQAAPARASLWVNYNPLAWPGRWIGETLAGLGAWKEMLSPWFPDSRDLEDIED